MNPKDYYKILGVEREADEAEVKKAYHKLAQEWHPDMHPEDTKLEAEEKFKEISEAYSVLSDEEKRNNYNATGSPDGRGPFGSRHGGFHTTGDPFEIFRRGFGGFTGQTGPRRSPPMRGQSVQQVMEISLKEALFGSERSINYQTASACETCEGKGATTFETCPSCKGSGGSSSHQGNMIMHQVCGDCVGEGQKPLKACDACEGRGIVPLQKNLTVSIPAKIPNGVTLKLTEQGGRGFHGGPAGDVLLTVNVQYPDIDALSDDERSQLGKLLSK